MFSKTRICLIGRRGPYPGACSWVLHFLELKENYPEADLEKAILRDLEKFIFEFGYGFTFVERQKRITINGNDFQLDLLFYHRILRRLVAVELKTGRFRPQFKGQIELLDMDQAGIAVAEYWTVLPPKNEFDRNTIKRHST